MVDIGPVHRLRNRVLRPVGRQVLRRAGVEHGPDLDLFGVPVVSREPGSTIRLGRNVTLISTPAFTALGVATPVVLRTYAAGARLQVGDDVGLSGTTICAVGEVVIGDRVLLGADVLITDTDFHPVHHAERRYAPMPAFAPEDAVHVADDAFLGTRSMLLKGARVGRNAVVGAGSVVVGEVPDGAIVAGVPARVVGEVRPERDPAGGPAA